MLSSVHHNTQEPSPFRRLAPPLIYGVSGIVLTLLIDSIPSVDSMWLTYGLFLFFLLTHIVWCQKIIRSERQKLNEFLTLSSGKMDATGLTALREQEATADLLVESNFIQSALDHLGVVHPLHIQASALKEIKTHLLQTDGLISLVQENQMEIFAQPIVKLPQKRPAFLTCIPCITIGEETVINLNTLVTGTSDEPFCQALERVILYRTLQTIRAQHKVQSGYDYICHLPESIYKDSAAFEDLCHYLYQSHYPLNGLIFEISLEVAESIMSQFHPLQQLGVRFIGTTQVNPLFTPGVVEGISSIDFVKLSYPKIMHWFEQQPRRQILNYLQQMVDLNPPMIISDIPDEQGFYQNLPLSFDYGAGNAFGVLKPLSHTYG